MDGRSWGVLSISLPQEHPREQTLVISDETGPQGLHHLPIWGQLQGLGEGPLEGRCTVCCGVAVCRFWSEALALHCLLLPQDDTAEESEDEEDYFGVPTRRRKINPFEEAESAAVTAATPPAPWSLQTLSMDMWQKGESVAAKPNWSANLMQSTGFAGWLPTTNGAALRMMEAMGYQHGKGLGKQVVGHGKGLAEVRSGAEQPRVRAGAAQVTTNNRNSNRKNNSSSQSSTTNCSSNNSSEDNSSASSSTPPATVSSHSHIFGRCLMLP